PIKRNKWIETGNTRSVSAGTYRHTEFQHPPGWRGPTGGRCSIAVHKVFALESHPMLNRNPSTKCRDAVNILIADSLCVVEEPVETVERNVAVHVLEYVQESLDRFVVSGVESRGGALR